MTGGRRDIDEVEGVQLSAGWAVAQTAEARAASSNEHIRAAGRSLRCCEVIGLDRAPERLRQRNTQGVRVWLRFYLRPDLQIISDFRDEVATEIAQASGVAAGAVQLDIDLLDNERLWIGLEAAVLPLPSYRTSQTFVSGGKERHVVVGAGGRDHDPHRGLVTAGSVSRPDHDAHLSGSTGMLNSFVR